MENNDKEDIRVQIRINHRLNPNLYSMLEHVPQKHRNIKLLMLLSNSYDNPLNTNKEHAELIKKTSPDVEPIAEEIESQKVESVKAMSMDSETTGYIQSLQDQSLEASSNNPTDFDLDFKQLGDDFR